MPNTDSEYHRDSDWNILARIEKKLTNRPVRICRVVDFMCKQMYLLMNATRYLSEACVKKFAYVLICGFTSCKFFLLFSSNFFSTLAFGVIMEWVYILCEWASL